MYAVAANVVAVEIGGAKVHLTRDREDHITAVELAAGLWVVADNVEAVYSEAVVPGCVPEVQRCDKDGCMQIAVAVDMVVGDMDDWEIVGGMVADPFVDMSPMQDSTLLSVQEAFLS